MCVPHLLLTVRQLVARDVVALRVCAHRCDPSIGCEDVFVILAAPSFVVDVEQRLLVLTLNLELNGGAAPDVLCIKHINLFACFDVCHLVLLLPLLVIFDPLFKSLSLIFVSIVTLAIDQHLDSIVNNL